MGAVGPVARREPSSVTDLSGVPRPRRRRISRWGIARVAFGAVLAMSPPVTGVHDVVGQRAAAYEVATADEALEPTARATTDARASRVAPADARAAMATAVVVALAAYAAAGLALRRGGRDRVALATLDAATAERSGGGAGDVASRPKAAPRRQGARERRPYQPPVHSRRPGRHGRRRRALRPRLPAAPPGPQVRMHGADLLDHAGLRSTPPEGLFPAEGSLLRDDAESDDQLAACWLRVASSGAVEVRNEGDHLVLARTGRRAGDTELDHAVHRAFAGRDEVVLGSYDEAVAAGSRVLTGEVRSWRASSGAWTSWSGCLPLVVATVLLSGASLGFLIVRHGTGRLLDGAGAVGLALVAIGAVVGSVNIAAVVFGHLASVRTPAGSAVLLQVESFRRYLAAVTPEDVAAIAARGELRTYTAWAVALGQATPWAAAVTAAPALPDAARDEALLAPRLAGCLRRSVRRPGR